MSIRHKPLFRPRVRYGVERNRQVDGARRRERASDLERGLPRRGPRAPTQALVAHEFADRVIARAGQSQLLGAFSNATPCLRSRLTVAIVSNDERLESWVLPSYGETHLPIVPEHLRKLLNEFATKDENVACV